MRKCSRCHLIKELSLFVKRANGIEGKSTICKECHNSRNRLNRRANLEQYRKTSAAWREANRDKIRKYHRQHRKDNAEQYRALQIARTTKNAAKYRQYRRNYYQRNKDAVLAAQRERRDKNPAQYKARYLLGYAVKCGKITKPSTCNRCGEEKRLEGHHEDYSKPLEVEWLCRKCHAAHHRQYPREEG